MSEPRYLERLRRLRLTRRSLTVASGTALLLAACGRGKRQSTATLPAGQGADGAPERGGTFSTYWNANPPSLDPQFFATGATTSFACAAMS
ncbi:MAG TPA: hypothetical protein VK821_20890, partial [Dehalococcoidia bacterium]|nr:hypothetical protein [Dehalococcoidia bacterium]